MGLESRADKYPLARSNLLRDGGTFDPSIGAFSQAIATDDVAGERKDKAGVVVAL